MRSLVLLTLFLFSVNSFAFMTAREARCNATRERLTRERACIDGFVDDLDKAITNATGRDITFVDSDCYTCSHGLYSIAKKLEKRGYHVTFKSCEYYPNTKFLHVHW